jgi:membrane protein YdbS with pleckstrin-like domain
MKIETPILTAIALSITIIAVIITYYAIISSAWVLAGFGIFGILAGLAAAFVIGVTHNDRYL